MTVLFDKLNDELQSNGIPRDSDVVHHIDRLKHCKEFLRDTIKVLPDLGDITVKELYDELDKYS